MNGSMMPSPMQPRRRRPGEMPGIGTLVAPEAGGMAAAPPAMMGPTAVPPTMGPPSMMAGGGMGPDAMSPEQAEELRRWFEQNRPESLYRPSARPMR